MTSEMSRCSFTTLLFVGPRGICGPPGQPGLGFKGDKGNTGTSGPRGVCGCPGDTGPQGIPVSKMI